MWRFNITFWAGILSALACDAQDLTRPYLVQTNGDTVFCTEVKLKSDAVVAYIGEQRKEIRFEFIRALYAPTSDKAFESFFKSYQNTRASSIYPMMPRQVQQVLSSGIVPRYFEIKPLDEEDNFWNRMLFETLLKKNGWILCKRKGDSGSGPSFASGKSEASPFFIFPVDRAMGENISRDNYRELLSRFFADCPQGLNFINSKSFKANDDYFNEVLITALSCP
ncbi:MAG TPA: hypothetical protein VFV37_08210 [Luteibaculaceae bacterium]|nr:hypothetical protein [Luteibaculaceae bacterium]